MSDALLTVRQVVVEPSECAAAYGSLLTPPAHLCTIDRTIARRRGPVHCAVTATTATTAGGVVTEESCIGAWG